MFYYFLRKIDLFDKKFNFRINRQSTLSTLEGIACSVFFYLLCLVIICYNVLSAYIKNEPILKSQELIRDLSVFEQLPASAFGMGIGYYVFDPIKKSLNLLTHSDKEQYIMASALNNTNITYTPRFAYHQEVSGLFGECPNEVKEKVLIAMNMQCYQFKNSSYVIGGSAFETGSEALMEASTSIPICDFASMYDSSQSINSNQTAEEIIKNNLANLKSLCKTNPIIPTAIIGFIYSSDLVDIYSDVGFKTHNITEYQNFDYTTKKLYVSVRITKSIIDTDVNMLYKFRSNEVNTYYEKRIEFRFVEKPADKNIDLNIRYYLDVKVKMTNRSYNKVDNILADSFSIMELLFILLDFFVHISTKKAVEYEIINSIYYETPKLKPNLVIEAVNENGKRMSLVRSNLNNRASRISGISETGLNINDKNRNGKDNQQSDSNTSNSISSEESSKSNNLYQVEKEYNTVSTPKSAVSENNDIISMNSNNNLNSNLLYQSKRPTNANRGEFEALNLNDRTLNLDHTVMNHENQDPELLQRNLNGNPQPSPNKDPNVMLNNYQDPSKKVRVIDKQTNNIKINNNLNINEIEYDSRNDDKNYEEINMPITNRNLLENPYNTKNNFNSITQLNLNQNQLVQPYNQNSNNINRVSNYSQINENQKKASIGNISNLNIIVNNNNNDLQQRPIEAIEHRRGLKKDPLKQDTPRFAKRLNIRSGFIYFLVDKCCVCFFKRQEKRNISQRKAIEVLHREIDIVVILKKMIEMEFLTKKFYMEQSSNSRRSSVTYDNAFYYTNRNVNNAEDIFFTMDYKYFGSLNFLKNNEKTLESRMTQIF